MHRARSMKCCPKLSFNRSKVLLLQIFLYRHFFFQTAVTSKRKKLPQIRWCQNSRIVEGFHPLFHESDLAPLFHPLSASFVKEGTFSGCSRWAKVGHFGPNMPPGTLSIMQKRNDSGNLNLSFAVVFCDLFQISLFQSFSLRPQTHLSLLREVPRN